jgi:hypothetical protein
MGAIEGGGPAEGKGVASADGSAAESGVTTGVGSSAPDEGTRETGVTGGEVRRDATDGAGDAGFGTSISLPSILMSSVGRE